MALDHTKQDRDKMRSPFGLAKGRAVLADGTVADQVSKAANATT